MKDSQPLSSGAQRLLLLLSPKMLLFGRLQAHSDHLRTSQHLWEEERRTLIFSGSLKVWWPEGKARGQNGDWRVKTRWAAGVTAIKWSHAGGDSEERRNFVVSCSAALPAPPAGGALIGSFIFAVHLEQTINFISTKAFCIYIPEWANKICVFKYHKQ